ncbi:MAG: hypothetical protein JRG71_03925 [Deltaproteobacteria bacterium]|nr:hypothetical protein [Deltaproteobacteria bacterium]
MRLRRSNSINIYSFLIAIGLLQLIWPWGLWLVSYRLIAACCLAFMVFSLFFLLLITNDEHFKKKHNHGKQGPMISLQGGIMLLLAWLMRDPSVLWLSVSLIILGMVYRLVILKRVYGRPLV